VDDINELASLWQDLEDRADHEFFLSWLWISVWLKVFKPGVQLLTIRQQQQPVALALVTRSVQRRHGWLHSRVIRLHQTGNPQEDQIWIEYNDLLVDQAHREGAIAALVQFIEQGSDDWDEWIVGASCEAQLKSWVSDSLHKHVLWEAPAYGVDLRELRQSGNEYLQSLSRNARYQLKKAYKKALQLGVITYSKAETQQQALQWFEELGSLHLQRWRDESGFVNGRFTDFHTELIQQGLPAGQVELVRIELGDQLLGILYNFIYAGKVYFYLSGINYQLDASIKPGLLCQVECINSHLNAGANYYDFMGGDARYKRSLGKLGANLQLVAMQQPAIKLRLEQQLRRLKRLFVNG
jgi:CelD/BcsL family acetyltransferase involved in cellulose biosynthesis